MTIDIARMRLLVRKPLGMTDTSDTDLLDSDIDEYLNRSFWEIQDKLPFREKEVVGSFSTVAGTREYQMPAGYEYLTGLSIVDPDSGQHTNLDQMEYAEYEGLYIDDTITTGSQTTPTNYVRVAASFVLYPTPDKIYTCVIRRRSILADLSNANNVSPLPHIWTEVIIYGAVARAFYDFGDIVRGKEYEDLRTRVLRSTKPIEDKELIDTRHAGLEVLGREY